MNQRSNETNETSRWFKNRDPFIPKRWGSPTTFERVTFSPSRKVPSRIARILIVKHLCIPSWPYRPMVKRCQPPMSRRACWNTHEIRYNIVKLFYSKSGEVFQNTHDLSINSLFSGTMKLLPTWNTAGLEDEFPLFKKKNEPVHVWALNLPAHTTQIVYLGIRPSWN